MNYYPQGSSHLALTIPTITKALWFLQLMHGKNVYCNYTATPL